MSALKSCIDINKSQTNFWKYFLQGKASFFRAKNSNVTTKTLWSVLCWLLLWLADSQPKLYWIKEWVETSSKKMLPLADTPHISRCYIHTAITWSCKQYNVSMQDHIKSIYRTRAIITRGLYTFYPLFEVQKCFFLIFWPYVWLLFQSSF